MQYSVVHSVHMWLPQTMTWLNTQVLSLPPRIVSHVVADKAKNLEQFPIENLVTADNDARPWRWLGSRSWTVARRRNAYLLSDRIRRARASVLHSHFGDRAWCNMPIAAQTGARHVVTFYGYDVGRLPTRDPEWRVHYRRLFQEAQLFLCEGPHMAQSLIALGCPQEKVCVHRLGISIASLQWRPRRWTPTQPLRVLLAGTFTEKKGLPYAIHALARIHNRVDLQITIVGDAPHREPELREKSQILRALESTGLRSRTRLTGYIPHSALIAMAMDHHIFVSPSVTASDGDTEGGAPVTIVELAATGMPVVSTRHCDIPDVLEDGVSGLLAEERNVDELEWKLCWLLNHPDRWELMTAAARSRIEKEFDAKVQGKRLGEHYDRLLRAG